MSKDYLPTEILERITWAEKRCPKDPDQIENIKHDPRPCEDCDLLIENRHIQHRLHESPRRHFRRKCLNCKLYYNPETDKYDLTSKDVLAVFRRVFEKSDK
jgi:hypothetical protein